MTHRSRQFLVYASLLAATGLSVGAVAYYGDLGAALGRQEAAADLQYVPSGAIAVAHADVRGIMTSELRQKLLDALPGRGKEHSRFREETGVDLENDIDSVLAVLMPAASDHSGFAVLRGRFDPVRLEALAREHGGQVTDYKGKRLIGLAGRNDDTRPGNRERHAALVFAEPGVVLLGDAALVQQAVDASQGGGSVASSQELARLIEEVDKTGSAWAVGRFEALVQGARLPDGIAAKVPPVQWFSASARVDGGVAGTLKAEASDEQAARNLRELLNGLFALARLQAGDRPEVQALVSGLNLSGAGKTIELAFNIPASVIDLLPRHEDGRRSAP